MKYASKQVDMDQLNSLILVTHYHPLWLCSIPPPVGWKSSASLLHSGVHHLRHGHLTISVHHKYSNLCGGGNCMYSWNIDLEHFVQCIIQENIYARIADWAIDCFWVVPTVEVAILLCSGRCIRLPCPIAALVVTSKQPKLRLDVFVKATTSLTVAED